LEEVTLNFQFTEEQKQIRSLIREFAKREIDLNYMWELSDKAAHAKTLDELRAIQPLDLIKKLHDVGLREFCVPAKYGGGNATQGGCMTRAIASEEAGYSMAIGCRLLATPWNHCAQIAGLHTTEEQKDWFFTQFMDNPIMQVGHVGSEPSSMTDFSLPYDEPGYSMKTKAYKDGNEWVINGDKSFSSAGGVADLCFVCARTDWEGPISKSFSMFWVPKDSPGMTQVPNRLVGGEISGNVQTFFDDVRIPESYMFGELNKGGLVEKDYLAAKMLHFANMLGQAQYIYDQMRTYTKEKIAGGKPLIEHNNVQVLLGEAALGLDTARAYMYKVAWENDQRELAGKPVNLYWTLGFYTYVKKVSWRLCEIASDIYGGISGSLDMPIEKFLRRVYTFMPTGGGTYSIQMMKCSREYDDRCFEAG
jgi:alkylation response protein AidB-like acyl-CoA dehydrogenase